MDILNMTYEPETFDVVLEKGTLDALWYMKEILGILVQKLKIL